MKIIEQFDESDSIDYVFRYEMGTFYACLHESNEVYFLARKGWVLREQSLQRFLSFCASVDHKLLDVEKEECIYGTIPESIK